MVLSFCQLHYEPWRTEADGNVSGWLLRRRPSTTRSGLFLRLLGLAKWISLLYHKRGIQGFRILGILSRAAPAKVKCYSTVPCAGIGM